MPINLLAISVGNTRTRFGVFIDGNLEHHDVIENKRFSRITEKLRDAHFRIANLDEPTIMLASVDVQTGERIEEFVKTALQGRFVRAESDINVPIGRQLDPEALVGEDRLLNAAAAYDVLKQNCVVVDAGTAITVDFVDGAGTFHGGAIAPGAALQLSSLNSSTSQLPETTIAKPNEAIGHNTVDAMRSGVYFGLRGLVKELIEQYAEIAGSFPMVVATGGDADLLFEGDELIDRIAPHLTLLGMAITLKKEAEAE